jgi:hypothetical protein
MVVPSRRQFWGGNWEFFGQIRLSDPIPAVTAPTPARSSRRRRGRGIAAPPASDAVQHTVTGVLNPSYHKTFAPQLLNWCGAKAEPSATPGAVQRRAPFPRQHRGTLTEPVHRAQKPPGPLLSPAAMSGLLTCVVCSE